MTPLRHQLGDHFLITGASEILRLDLSWAGSLERAPDQVLWAREGKVAYVGPASGLPPEAESAARHDVGGRAVLPAFVDCHTHIVFGGDRVDDFAKRAAGVSYAEIAAAGGGIQTTVRATRSTSSEALADRARRFLERREAQGVLTTEIKSGYGLNEETELRMLEVAALLRREGWDIESTLLAAHAVPKDRDRQDWLQAIENVLIPRVAGEKLARFVDVFVEKGAYTVEEARSVFECARHHGLHPRVHADQLSAGGGAELAAEVGAASADHIEHVSEAGIQAMADARVVGVLLPGAMLHLGDSAPGLGRRLQDGGVETAISTDANPGSSPTHNLGLMATLAVTQLGCSVEQALRGCTLGAARALKRHDVGHLEVGALARCVVLEHADARSWVEAYGEPLIRELITA